MRQTIFASIFILGLCLFSFTALAADYEGESGYKQFVQCNTWTEQNRSNNNNLNKSTASLNELESKIDSVDDTLDSWEGDLNVLELNIGMAESFGNVNSYNNYVDQYNAVLRKFKSKNRYRQRLYDDYSERIEQHNDLYERNENLVAKAQRYCAGKSWTQEIVDRACNTYNSDTSSFCEGFD